MIDSRLPPKPTHVSRPTWSQISQWHHRARNNLHFFPIPCFPFEYPGRRSFSDPLRHPIFVPCRLDRLTSTSNNSGSNQDLINQNSLSIGDIADQLFGGMLRCLFGRLIMLSNRNASIFNSSIPLNVSCFSLWVDQHTLWATYVKIILYIWCVNRFEQQRAVGVNSRMLITLLCVLLYCQSTNNQSIPKVNVADFQRCISLYLHFMIAIFIVITSGSLFSFAFGSVMGASIVLSIDCYRLGDD